MTIFAEIVLFALAVFGVIDYIRLKAQNKIQANKIEELTEKNAELLELITSDEVDRLGAPPAGKRILHG
jgi:cell division protein FtsB